MLRRQSPDITPLSFLAGDGEMARRIRDFPWYGHPMGEPDGWPAALRAALGICLNSAFPVAIYWGSDLRLLYNDAWSSIPGPRHPACLGEPAEEVWGDIWHVIEPQFTQVIETGTGFFVPEQMLPMRRFGYEEETWWSYSFTPIRGEDGAIEGIYNSGVERTQAVLKQRQTAFILDLADTFQRQTDVTGITETVCRLLGDHLGAVRVGFVELDARTAERPVTAEWCADGTPPSGPEVRHPALEMLSPDLLAGRVVRIDRAASLSPDALTEVLGASPTGGLLALPWQQGGRLRAVLYVHRPRSGPWSDEDVGTAEQTLSRTMQRIEAARATVRERVMMHEIDHRARNMLGVSQALVRLTRAEDVDAFRESLTDRMAALGRTLSLLSSSRWAGATLRDLLMTELSPYMDPHQPRATLSGPVVVISNETAQALSMAIHELTANAVKHGALSNAAGRIAVVWDMDAEDRMTLTWSETGGGAAPSGAHRGLGTRLLSLVVETQLDGTLTRTHADGRFVVEAVLPMSDA